MDRSLYPEGVEVGSSDLVNTESTRAFHILRRHTDNTLTGVVSGLLVTVNDSNPSTIDIAAGTGYSPNGEFIEILSDISGVELADDADGVVNFVLAVYTETFDSLKPHETNGDSFPTRGNRSVRISVLTETAFNALPQTDTNLDNDSVDRSLIIAKVTGAGSGVSITSGDIELPSSLSGGVSAINTTRNITGVDIVRINVDTPTGSGTLFFNSSTSELEWTAPGDVSGNPVDVSSGGAFTLTSVPSNLTLVVLVTETDLPTSDQTDIIDVTNIYNQNIPRHTSVDLLHRSLVGSGIPTSSNPHGLTLDDLGVDVGNVEEHQSLFHDNGIHRDSNSNVLEPTVSTGSVPHSIDIISPLPGDRFYIDGRLYNSIANPSIGFDDVSQNKQGLYNIYALESETTISTLEKVLRIQYDNDSPPGPNDLATVVQLRDLSDSISSGTAEIRYTSSTDTLEFKAPGDVFGPAISVPDITDGISLRLFSDNNIFYIDVFVEAISSWPSLGNITEPLTISSLPSDLDSRFIITTAMFSGSATGFVGNGFGAGNSPNDIKDRRLFGLTGPDDLRDDVIAFFVGEDNGASTPAAITDKRVGILGDGSKYALDDSQLSVLGVPKVFGRNTEQHNIFSSINYATAEDGLKQGIRSDVATSYSSGSISNLRGILSRIDLKHTSSLDEVISLWGRVDVDSGATVTEVKGIRIDDVGGTTTTGADITDQIGLQIQSQTKGANNFAIRTGLGRIQFGDTTGIEFTGTGDPLILFRDDDASSIIDGTTNPGSNQYRISHVFNTVKGFINASNLPGDNALLIEKLDENQNDPDSSIVFANTGQDGSIDASLIILGDGTVRPGLDDNQDFGAATERWSNIYSVNIEADSMSGPIDIVGSADTLRITPSPSGLVPNEFDSVNDEGFLFKLDSVSEKVQFGNIASYFNGTGLQHGGLSSDPNSLDTNVVLSVIGETQAQQPFRVHHSGDSAGNVGMRVAAGVNSPTVTGDIEWIHLYDGDNSSAVSVIRFSDTAPNAEFASASDERLKENIMPTDIVGLDIINNINLIKFDWIDRNRPSQDIGYIAQQVKEVYPSMVSKDKDGYLMVGDSCLIPILVKSIQELHNRVSELEETNVYSKHSR